MALQSLRFHRRLSHETVFWIAGIAGASAAGLLLWVRGFRPDLSAYTAAVPRSRPALLALGVIGFSLFNGIGLSFLYCIFLGVLRHRFEGLLVPSIAHVLTDGVIVFIVVRTAMG